MWAPIIVVIIVAWILQAVFTFMQMANFRQRMQELRTKGTLGVGKVSKKFGIGAIVLLVSSDQKTITEAEELFGVTVFARFKKDEALKGLSFEEVEKLEFEKDSKQEAVEQALKNLKKKLEK
ncbi:transcriptional regulator GutM [Halanaerobium sp. Z-7514]|uniref:Transcriptional regulator GutM n=1 Tax=Halanaerobium polyolivorans TaxID=2886943 RepID=A0AAW4WYK4_9FIRM|nr:transcriptional regulator GutM [Halanaerobium polyolivorans]MCC3144632.1 transcriptional regulator GutM [Halanaerobium polyolivorans]